MVYALLRLGLRSRSTAFATTALMLGIELFQLTEVAAHMLRSEHLMVRMVARLMGTYFSWLDLLAYAIAIGFMYSFDLIQARRESSAPVQR